METKPALNLSARPPLPSLLTDCVLIGQWVLAQLQKAEAAEKETLQQLVNFLRPPA
jgi:hypothetical protein